MIKLFCFRNIYMTSCRNQTSSCLCWREAVLVCLNRCTPFHLLLPGQSHAIS